jgi:hypothetical protein
MKEKKFMKEKKTFDGIAKRNGMERSYKIKLYMRDLVNVTRQEQY